MDKMREEGIKGQTQDMKHFIKRNSTSTTEHKYEFKAVLMSVNTFHIFQQDKITQTLHTCIQEKVLRSIILS